MKNATHLAIVIPCLNEELMLPETVSRLSVIFQEMIGQNLISGQSFICFVDDGSKDRTWNLIDNMAQTNPAIRGIRLSRNFGHQSALLAGLFYCQDHVDCIITIDADLQDDPGVIPDMVRKFRDGCEIVYGVRKKRNTDTWFKSATAIGFYKLMRLLGVTIIHNHADFRLASSRAVRELERYSEVNLFLRGIFPILGFSHSIVYYDRLERSHGETKYPFRKMVNFAFEGIYSFSVKPLQIITRFGFIIFVLSLLASGYAIWGYFTGQTVPGWVSTVLPFYFLGGVQILCIGILGEYIGKIYKEVKRRPRFTIDCHAGFEQGK
jgi:glycosyltransferase involved in cell wall biosynthesis